MKLVQLPSWMPTPALRQTAAKAVRHLMSPIPSPRNKDDMEGWSLFDIANPQLLKKRAKKENPSNMMLDFLLQEKLITDAVAAELSILLSAMVRKSWCKAPYDIPFVFADVDWNARKSTITSLLFRMRKFRIDLGTCYSIGEPIFIEHEGQKYEFIFSSHTLERIIERCSLPSDMPEMACWVISYLRPDGLVPLAAHGDIGARMKLVNKTLTDINLLGYCPIVFDRGYAVAKTFLTPYLIGTPHSEKISATSIRYPLDNIKSMFSKSTCAILSKAGIPTETPTYCHWLPNRFQRI